MGVMVDMVGGGDCIRLLLHRDIGGIAVGVIAVGGGGRLVVRPWRMSAHAAQRRNSSLKVSTSITWPPATRHDAAV